MKPFGQFLSNLRNSHELSLTELAILVHSSKSTLSRLENNEIPRPFKTAIRTLIIRLAELLCSSRQEVERYLELAAIDVTLLTENEKIQLGLTESILLKEPYAQEQFERVYEQRIQELRQRLALVKTIPPQVERKAQEYALLLEEIRKKGHLQVNGQGVFANQAVQQAPVYRTSPSDEGSLLILNFNHPLTEQQKVQIEKLAGRAIDEIIALATQIDESESIVPQIARLVESIGLTLEDWQKNDIFINPPGYAIAASLVLAEIHGRIGHFPAVIRLRPKHEAATSYEVIELLNLQRIRDRARPTSNANSKHPDRHIGTALA